MRVFAEVLFCCLGEESGNKIVDDDLGVLGEAQDVIRSSRERRHDRRALYVAFE